MNTIRIALLISIVACSTVVAKPRWVRMLDNPETNYFKAVKRYDRYWKKHFHPEGDREDREAKESSEKDPRPMLVKWFQSEEKAKEKSNSLNIDYKKFKKWQYEMLPYVQSNGKLMSLEERLEAWKQLQK